MMLKRLLCSLSLPGLALVAFAGCGAPEEGDAPSPDEVDDIEGAATAGPLGSGWVAYSPTKKIHLNDDVDLQIFSWTASKSVCSPTCADYHYDSSTDTETFRMLDNRSNRAEIRLQNEYSSG